MLRITAAATPPHLVTLRLEGQLIDRWVMELENSCDNALSNRGRVVLDLVGVSFIDRHGLALLRTLSDRNVTLINASPFVAQLLKGAGL
jgi:ABC-type transporter Mla MlaB component